MSTVLKSPPREHAVPTAHVRGLGIAAEEPRLETPRASRKGGFLRFVTTLAVGAAGVAGGWVWHRSVVEHQAKEQLTAVAHTVNRDPAEVVVTVTPVSIRPVQRQVVAVGTLHGFEEIPICAKVEGRVKSLSFDIADRVRPGDLLLQVDPTDLELSRRQSERELQVELAKLGLSEVPSAEVPLNNIPAVLQAASRKENAAKRLERIRPLVAARTVTVEEGDDAENEYRVADAEFANQLLIARTGLANIKLKQSALAVAQQQLVDSQVRAPTPTQSVPGSTNGVGYSVTSRTVSEGSFVRPGTEICKLVITETLKLRVPVPEAYSAEVQLGQKVNVMLAAFPAPFAGMVTRINPAVDAASRTFEVEIQVPNPNGQLKPGSFAKVHILSRMDAQSITVPLSALVNFAGVNKIFVAENGRAKEVQITTGVQTNEWVEITTPRINRGAQVITSGQTLLAAESPISIRETIDVAQKTSQLP